MYPKRAATLALTLLVLSSYFIIDLDSAQTENRDAPLSSSVVRGKNDASIRTRFAGGDGTEYEPYQISNVSQLQDMHQDLSANYILVNDIDANETREWNGGKGFSPIANDTYLGDVSIFDGTPFTGSLDGKGYNITDLYIRRYREDFVGLFGYVSNSGHISNITLLDNMVSGNGSVGGIVGKNYGTIENCSAIGNVSGTNNVGGFIGDNYGNVQNCSVIGNVSGVNNVGGFIGDNYGNVQNCDATGNFWAAWALGGLIGINYGKVQNCYASGNIDGGWHSGGLIGDNYGMVEDCYAIGNLSSPWYAGGLVCDKYWHEPTGQISNSFYCINYTIIKNKHFVSPYGIYENQFEDWINGGKTLDIDDYLLKIPDTNYYNISSVSDMKMMLPFATFSGYKFKQTADIDLSSETEFYIAILNSTYNGNGHSISNLEKTNDDIGNIGMFGKVDNSGFVCNVSIINSYISGEDRIGHLSGTNKGMILNCSANGIASGFNTAGGLVGDNIGVVQNCYATGNVTGGGILGGLVGKNDGKVENCSTTGNVNGKLSIGGLMGYNVGMVQNCSATGNVTGNGYVGGLVGENDGKVENCYSTGNVIGDRGVGGLMGENYGQVENCYSTGDVIGDQMVGGLVGLSQGALGSIVNCYATGNVNGDKDVGGLVGENWGRIVENCFWDMETSGQLNSNGDIGKTTIEMMTKSTFTNASWDFDRIWAIYENIDYPYLQWERRPNINVNDSDNNSIPDIIDDFPNDPAASIDTDSDGYPDVWSPGMNETNSTTGLHLDAFPFDPAASLDSDGDGMPDEWNRGMNQSKSTSDPPLELDMYPADPINEPPDDDNPETPKDDSPEIPTDRSSKTWIWVSLAVVFVLLIVVVIAVLAWRKKKPQEKDDIGRVEPNDEKSD